ncbi:MAG: lipid A deacylase LpxR family protein [Hyphomonadaceae bacterium]|nr:lipid A deacylase LpxR family protein [Hyphomonadaceae bacterium]
MRRFLITALAFLGLASQAMGQERGVISLTSENDLFGGTDRNYSNGIRIERVSPADRVFPVLREAADLVPGLDLERIKLHQGFALAHAIYTPEDISAPVPDPEDRPYAGWLHVSGTVVARDAKTQDSLQLNLGMVGPSAAGKFVQTNWHEMINGVEPRGWDSQLHDEPGLELIAQRLRMYDGPGLPFNLETDYGLHYGGALGNVRTYAAIGGMARIGFDLGSDFGPPRIRPALSGAGVFDPHEELGGYLFIGADARAVARDIFLDGNSFRDSPSVRDRRILVGDIQTGIALHYKAVQVSFTYVHRTEQFVAQDGPQRFGAISISIAR